MTMPLFGRVRGLINQASGAVSRTEQIVQALAQDLHEAVDETVNGFTIEVENTGTGTVIDFLTGKTKTLPLRFKVKIKEDPVQVKK
jgi:ABC-type phosphate transport system substrate-binding protein